MLNLSFVGQKRHGVRLFPLFALCREFSTLEGFRLTARGDDRFLEMMLEAYFMEEVVELTNGGSSLTRYFNDLSRLFHLPVARDIYPEPTQTAFFNGYPVYYNGQSECAVIAQTI